MNLVEAGFNIGFIVKGRLVVVVVVAGWEWCAGGEGVEKEGEEIGVGGEAGAGALTSEGETLTVAPLLVDALNDGEEELKSRARGGLGGGGMVDAEQKSGGTTSVSHEMFKEGRLKYLFVY